jgi:DNA-binding MarR family transcriptional regulator
VTWERSHHKSLSSMYKHCYIGGMDLLDSSHWRNVHRVLGAMDADIAGLYTEAGIEGVRPRFVGPLIDLHRFGPLTIRELADRREVSHSAMSQTAAAMRSSGLVEPADEPGGDARTRRIQLTARSREHVPFLIAEWRATERTVRQLDAELPYSLDQLANELTALLDQRSFAERLRANLQA